MIFPFAIRTAAQKGHADAQHYYATALASGIWPTARTQQQQHRQYLDDPALADLLWHMSAMDGNIEAAMALGYRQEHAKGCEAALPYKEAAVHGIMDRLEADPHSRAKITPPMDKHTLPEIHTHGGTSSQLAWDNKPNESPEAIQYYHIRATAPQVTDIYAAYTLGHLYHYGLRGVEQNMTKALVYYEIAANGGHREAAGQAGKFHLWSLGMHPSERNIFKAHKYFTLGAPKGVESCKNLHRLALKKKSKQHASSLEPTLILCDHPSLNGMGLLQLFGVPMVCPINIEKAKQYFMLARDMGNMDASYNLAMLRLGWMHAWKEASNNTDFTAVAVPEFMQQSPPSLNAVDYGFAVHELTNAANKGHLQARHRLAMIYHHGISLAGKSNPIFQPDCSKAMTHYQWILDNAAIPWSQRTRVAYEQYMQGNLEGSLRNYLIAAETGHAISQVNAAFLLERGTCLGMSADSCRTSSLRYWKAAAQQGHAEAALRVGDFYYFGNANTLQWLRPFLFPEVALLQFGTNLLSHCSQWIQVNLLDQELPQEVTTASEDCQDTNAANGQCLAAQTPSNNRIDLTKAAHYYRLASEQHNSPRAHFNLGYMHEWGLGLQQDFPLAKRHYDKAKSSSNNHGEANFAVYLSLFAMNIHESYVKAQIRWMEYQESQRSEESQSTDEATTQFPLTKTTKLEVIIKHVVSLESLVIVILTFILSKIFQIRVRTVR